MSTDRSYTSDMNSSDAWQRIEGLVEEIAQLSRASLAAGEFHQQVLAKTIDALAAIGGAVWMPQQGGLRLDCQIDFPVGSLDETARSQHGQLAALVCASGKPLGAPPRSGPYRSGNHSTQPAANPTSYLLLLAPFPHPAGQAGLIEIVQPGDTSPEAREGSLQLLAAVCELTADFHTTHQLQLLQQEQLQWSQYRELVEQLTGRLDLRTAAYVLASEGRRFLGCDRVTVAAKQDRKFKVAAISGVDSFDARSNRVKMREKLAKTAASCGEAVWYPAEVNEYPPEIESALEDCLDDDHARTLVAVPLIPAHYGESPQVAGVLIIEQFHEIAPPALEQRIGQLAPTAAAALHSAAEYESTPLLAILKGLKKATWWSRWENLPKFTGALIAVAVVLAAMVLIPYPFSVEARGTLQPRLRRDIFAPHDGVVKRLPWSATGKESVQEKEVLAELQSSEIEQEIARILGEMQTAEKRKGAVQAARADPALAADSPERYRLTAELEQLRLRLESLQQQQNLVVAQQAELILKSPLSGRIITWDASQRLAGRPVQRGDLLLSVADLSGAWQLELEIPDRNAGHVLQANQRQSGKLPISYILATDPGVRWRGELSKLGDVAQPGDQGEPVISAKANLIDPPEELRPGATVIARIECGAKPIGYVWLHDFIDAVRKWLFV